MKNCYAAYSAANSSFFFFNSAEFNLQMQQNSD